MDIADLKWKAISHYTKAVVPELQKDLEEAWINDDLEGCLVAMSNMEYMPFLISHLEPLIKNGFYEEILFDALTMPSINLHHVPFQTLRNLLSIANKEKLRSMGDPIPGNGPFVLYRGVSGIGAKRRTRGLSWTLDLDKAKWFSTRLKLEKPMVYEAVISIDQVYAYDNGREEQEFICLINGDHKLKKLKV